MFVNLFLCVCMHFAVSIYLSISNLYCLFIYLSQTVGFYLSMSVYLLFNLKNLGFFNKYIYIVF